MKYLTLIFLFIFNSVYAQVDKQIKICIDTCKTLPSLDKYWNTLDYSQRSNPAIISYFQKKYSRLPRDSSYYTTYQASDNLQDSVKKNSTKIVTTNIKFAGAELKKAADMVVFGLIVDAVGIAIIFLVPTAPVIGGIVCIIGTGIALSAWIHIHKAGELLESNY